MSSLSENKVRAEDTVPRIWSSNSIELLFDFFSYERLDDVTESGPVLGSLGEVTSRLGKTLVLVLVVVNNFEQYLPLRHLQIVVR